MPHSKSPVPALPSTNHHCIFKMLDHIDNESCTIGEMPLPKPPIPAERKQSRLQTQKFPVWRGLKKKRNNCAELMRMLLSGAEAPFTMIFLGGHPNTPSKRGGQFNHEGRH